MVTRGRVRQKKSARADMESAPTAQVSASSMTPTKYLWGSPFVFPPVLCAAAYSRFPGAASAGSSARPRSVPDRPSETAPAAFGYTAPLSGGILLRQLQQPFLKLTVRIECPVEADGILKFERCPLFSAFPKPFHTDSPILCRPFRQYRIILSADTASEVRQMLSQKRR